MMHRAFFDTAVGRVEDNPDYLLFSLMGEFELGFFAALQLIRKHGHNGPKLRAAARVLSASRSVPN